MTLIIELFFGSILHLISPPNGSKQFQRGPFRYPGAHEKPQSEFSAPLLDSKGPSKSTPATQNNNFEKNNFL